MSLCQHSSCWTSKGAAVVPFPTVQMHGVDKGRGGRGGQAELYMPLLEWQSSSISLLSLLSCESVIDCSKVTSDNKVFGLSTVPLLATEHKNDRTFQNIRAQISAEAAWHSKQGICDLGSGGLQDVVASRNRAMAKT